MNQSNLNKCKIHLLGLMQIADMENDPNLKNISNILFKVIEANQTERLNNWISSFEKTMATLSKIQSAIKKEESIVECTVQDLLKELNIKIENV